MQSIKKLPAKAKSNSYPAEPSVPIKPTLSFAEKMATIIITVNKVAKSLVPNPKIMARGACIPFL